MFIAWTYVMREDLTGDKDRRRRAKELQKLKVMRIYRGVIKGSVISEFDWRKKKVSADAVRCRVSDFCIRVKNSERAIPCAREPRWKEMETESCVKLTANRRSARRNMRRRFNRTPRPRRVTALLSRDCSGTWSKPDMLWPKKLWKTSEEIPVPLGHRRTKRHPS